MIEGTRQPDWVGRSIGLAVFALGIVLLVVVFFWTNQLINSVPASGQPPNWVNWSVQFGVRIATLFVSGLVASWIAGAGARLYAAANRALSGD